VVSDCTQRRDERPADSTREFGHQQRDACAVGSGFPDELLRLEQILCVGAVWNVAREVRREQLAGRAADFADEAELRERSAIDGVVERLACE
jgi:hypothetical protein